MYAPIDFSTSWSGCAIALDIGEQPVAKLLVGNRKERGLRRAHLGVRDERD